MRRAFPPQRARRGTSLGPSQSRGRQRPSKRTAHRSSVHQDPRASRRYRSGTWAADLLRELNAEARPTSFDLRSYLGSPLPVLGVPAAGFRKIVRAFEARYRPVARKDLYRLVRLLWDGSTFDERALAIQLLDRHARELDSAAWKLLDRWVDDATGWGLCDGLAAGPIAALVASDRARVRSLLDWTRSRNPWRRRAALYALNRIVRAGGLRTALRVIGRLREDPEFWVQRAVGTWLRECWKHDPPRVRAYLTRYAGTLPPLSLTVATERETKAYRAWLRAKARAVRKDPPEPRARSRTPTLRRDSPQM